MLPRLPSTHQLTRAALSWGRRIGQIGLTAAQMLFRGWCKILPRHRWLKHGLFACVLLVLLVRSLPYLAPIRAADLHQDDQAIEFRDRNGLFLGTLLTRDQEHTSVVPLEQVSPHFLQAIIAAEDRRFYQHGGVDWWAVGRAIAEAVQARQVVSGASTIPMQLARMVQPTPRTLWGKVQEVWTTWRLAAGMSRAEILQAYVNRLPMGSNIYGVEAAAQVYFGTAARDLSVAQATILAALPNDPTDLNPYDHWQALKQRQRYVLQQMVAEGFLTQEQSDRAFATPLSLQPRHQSIVAAPHYLFWLAQQLPADHPPQVRTTLDLALQQFVEAQVQQVIDRLAPHQVRQAAVLVLDNHSGDVLAYVGSKDYFAEADGGRNDGVQALRQPGSTLKPFLYELALERGVIRPNTILADVPTYYAIPGAKLYSPTDYSETFLGPVRVRIALANSLNIPAVRVLEKVGVAAFLQRLHDLGFTHLDQAPEHYGLGLALGSGEVTLWELAHAYQHLLPTSHSSSLTALVTDMLSDRHARARSFGVDSVLSLPFPAAVKTGTSSDYRDTWTVGFTTDYTVATWVGNFDGQPMQQISGVTGAAPLWNRIMLHLHESHDPQPFPPPTGMVLRPICAISGMRPSPGCPAVVQEYFFPQDLTAYEQQADPFFRTVQRADGSVVATLNLPPDYNQWLTQQRQTPLMPGSLRILAPQNGDYFLMHSPRPGQPPQRLELKLTQASSRPVEWWLNGSKLSTTQTSSLFWEMRPGTWTLMVKQGDQTDTVQFEIQMADSQQRRRGFSVGDSASGQQAGAGDDGRARTGGSL